MKKQVLGDEFPKAFKDMPRFKKAEKKKTIRERPAGYTGDVGKVKKDGD